VGMSGALNPAAALPDGSVRADAGGGG